MKIPKFPIEGKVPIAVTITNGINKGGAPNVIVSFDGFCHYDEKARTVRGGDGIDIRLAGIAIIDGDIAPNVETITGHASISGGGTHKINSGRRIRDLTGAVHHTELELI